VQTNSFIVFVFSKSLSCLSKKRSILFSRIRTGPPGFLRDSFVGTLPHISS